MKGASVTLAIHSPVDGGIVETVTSVLSAGMGTVYRASLHMCSWGAVAIITMRRGLGQDAPAAPCSGGAGLRRCSFLFAIFICVRC